MFFTEITKSLHNMLVGNKNMAKLDNMLADCHKINSIGQFNIFFIRRNSLQIHLLQPRERFNLN